MHTLVGASGDYRGKIETACDYFSYFQTNLLDNCSNRPPEIPLPAELWGADPGVPLEDSCREVEAGVFERAWSKMTVVLDCNNWVASMNNI